MMVLITGSGGFVGKRLTAALAAAGHEVVALVRSQPVGHDQAYFASSRVTTFEADIANFDPDDLPKGIDAVVALAQSSHFREFPGRATEVFEVNVVANLRLLDWAVRNRIRRFVLASSGGIYGGTQGVALQESDQFPVNSPLGFYLGSKLCSEVVFQNYRQFLDVAIVLRPFFIYGPDQRPDMFMMRIINSVHDGRAITLQGPDGLKINPIYVDDAVTAFSRAIEISGGHIINIAGPDIVNLRTLGSMIGKRLGKKPVFESVAGEPVDHIADIGVAQHVLGLAPRSLADGLSESLKVR